MWLLCYWWLLARELILVDKVFRVVAGKKVLGWLF